jgi:3-methyl-2-oxobutanoate hydroxymethyltransferase
MMKNSRIRNINDFRKLKEEKSPISVVTCYDATFARIVARSSVDAILVGDSCGNVIAGYNSTIPVTMDQIIYHTCSVRRGAPDSFLIADLPFLSYHISVEDALRNAGRLFKETGAQAVKLEGGVEFADTVRALTRASIPVMGHLGLTPQSVHALGGYRVQGRTPDDAERMKCDARALEEAGAFAIVLEMVPESLAKEISELISIPTIGIGGGRYCDGQVLVLYDLLGLDDSYNPKYLKKFANLAETVRSALDEYHKDVVSRSFPDDDHVF